MQPHRHHQAPRAAGGMRPALRSIVMEGAVGRVRNLRVGSIAACRAPVGGVHTMVRRWRNIANPSGGGLPSGALGLPPIEARTTIAWLVGQAEDPAAERSMLDGMT